MPIEESDLDASEIGELKCRGNHGFEERRENKGNYMLGLGR